MVEGMEEQEKERSALSVSPSNCDTCSDSDILGHACFLRSIQRCCFVD